MRKKLLILAALFALVAYAYYSGVYTYLNQETLHRLLTQSGIWGPLIFIGLYVVGELINVPSVLWVVAAGLTWPAPQAFAIAWVASIVSAGVVFAFYRYVARDAVQGRLPERMKGLDARLQSGGIWVVTLIRLVAFLAPWSHPALAVSSVTLRDYLIGTAIGVIPGVAVLVLFGRQVTDWLATISLW